MAPYTTGQSFASPGNDAGVVRSTGTTGTGPQFDPSYLQNLATATGGNFMRPQGGVLNFNPLGDLSDIPSNPQGGGNAPVMGLPMGQQQYAQSIAPPPPSPAVNAPAPSNSIPSFGQPGTQAGPGGLNFNSVGNPAPATGSPYFNFLQQYMQQNGRMPSQQEAQQYLSTANLGFMFNPTGGFQLGGG